MDMQVFTERSSSLMRFISFISVADVALTSRVGGGEDQNLMRSD